MHVLENSILFNLALVNDFDFLMVVKVFLQHLKDKATKKALATNLALLTYDRYVDDSHARFETIQQ